MSRKKTVPEEFALDRLYKELQIHQTELEEQNRELREIQQRLEESRDRYADLFDFAPVGYVDLDGRGSIRGINLKGATMLGEARSRLLGMPFTRFVDPKNRTEFLAHLRKCREEKRTEIAGIVLRPMKAPPLSVQLQSAIYVGREEGTTAFRMAITDLSERVRAEGALRESEERFRSLVKVALVGFFIAQDGKIVFMNPEQERLIGRIPYSMPLVELDIAQPEDRRRFHALCDEVGSADPVGSPVDIRLLYPGKRKDGREFRWVRCNASRIAWQGRPAVLVNMLDITRTRELGQVTLV
ncbi:MAG TPA: PAS domain S-box protein, partial [Candidatus Deferrimicrobiaceae bacterium]|nr:PAS domain S-box protein [Candidatus Deferrimicrobiaceae bacterium]